MRRLEVAKMDPEVGSVFDSLDHIEGLVLSPQVVCINVIVAHARPQDDPANLGLHLDSKVGKARGATRRHVREVEKEGVDSYTRS